MSINLHDTNVVLELAVTFSFEGALLATYLPPAFVAGLLRFKVRSHLKLVICGEFDAKR